MSKVAVIGSGYWGKNLVRTFYNMQSAQLIWVCDLDQGLLKKLEHQYPGIKTTTRYEEVLDDPAVDAVAIATIAPLHYDMAKQALTLKKHVYVEKPMTLGVKDAEDLVKTAEASGKALMVGHILVYHPAVQKLKQLIDSGELGEIYYIYSHRLNLGKVRADENAMWSFAPHDLSVIFYLLGAKLTSVAAHGRSFLREGVEDVVFMNLQFDSGQIASIHLSWLDPHKRRHLTIVGSKKMVVFDDTEPTEKLRIYDKGVDFAGDYGSYGEYIALRFGDIVIPKVDMKEPLMLTLEAFLDQIKGNTGSCKSGVQEGLEVVQALNAAQQSLREGGAPVSC